MKKSKRYLGIFLSLLMLISVIVPSMGLAASAATVTQNGSDYAVIVDGAESEFELVAGITISNGTGTYGVLANESGATYSYTLFSIMNGVDKFTYDDGNIDIIPASVMYYEDTFNLDNGITDGANGFIFSGGWRYTGDDYETNVDGDFSGGNAHVVGARVGDIMTLQEWKDATGGTSSIAYLSYVSAQRYTGFKVDNVYNAQTLTFTFKGTGFDVIGYMADDVGAINAKITQNGEFISENYTPEEFTGLYTSDISAMYNTPILSRTGLPYGEYTVEITVEYTTPVGSKGNYVAIDAFRIYNAAGYAPEPVETKEESLLKLIAAGDVTAVGNANTALAAATKNERLVYSAGESFGFTISNNKDDAVKVVAQLEGRYVDGSCKLDIAIDGVYIKSVDVNSEQSKYIDLLDKDYLLESGKSITITVTVGEAYASTTEKTPLAAFSRLKVTKELSIGEPEKTAVGLVLDRTEVQLDVAGTTGIQERDVKVIGVVYDDGSVEAVKDGDNVEAISDDSSVVTASVSGNVVTLKSMASVEGSATIAISYAGKDIKLPVSVMKEVEGTTKDDTPENTWGSNYTGAYVSTKSNYAAGNVVLYNSLYYQRQNYQIGYGNIAPDWNGTNSYWTQAYLNKVTTGSQPGASETPTRTAIDLNSSSTSYSIESGKSAKTNALGLTLENSDTTYEAFPKVGSPEVQTRPTISGGENGITAEYDDGVITFKVDSNANIGATATFTVSYGSLNTRSFVVTVTAAPEIDGVNWGDISSSVTFKVGETKSYPISYSWDNGASSDIDSSDVVISGTTASINCVYDSSTKSLVFSGTAEGTATIAVSVNGVYEKQITVVVEEVPLYITQWYQLENNWVKSMPGLGTTNITISCKVGEIYYIQYSNWSATTFGAYYVCNKAFSINQTAIVGSMGNFTMLSPTPKSDNTLLADGTYVLADITGASGTAAQCDAPSLSPAAPQITALSTASDSASESSDSTSVILAGSGTDVVGPTTFVSEGSTNVTNAASFNAVKSMGTYPSMVAANNLSLVETEGAVTLESYYDFLIPEGSNANTVVISFADKYIDGVATSDLIAAMKSLIQTVNAKTPNAKIILVGSQGDYDRFMKKAAEQAGLSAIVSFCEDITSATGGKGAIAEQQEMANVVSAAIDSAAQLTVPETTVDEWVEGSSYQVGDVVVYNGVQYECVVAHTAKSAIWNPASFPQFWKVLA